MCRSPDIGHFQTVGERVYGRCRACEATFLSPAQFPTPEQERTRYESHQNAVDDPGYRSFLNRLAAPMIARLPPQSRGLDFGCGPGPALAHMLRDAGHHVSCYDPFFAPDTAVLETSYDFITATEVVEHLHEPASTFELLDALMRPGALLGIMTEFLTDDSRFAGWYYRNDISHVVFYTARTLKRLAERMGWEIEIPRKNVAIFSKPAQP
ncbi:MAG: class I SAM-dependent methyltransferase [Spirochaetota bacterium]